MFHHSKIKFYGTGTVGEKGQIVIPAKARKNLKIKPGDEFVFFGRGPIIHLVKARELNNIFSKMTQKFSKNFSGIKKQIKQSLKNNFKK